MVKARKPHAGVILSLVLLILATSIWFSWTIIVPASERALGRVILPIERGEGSGVIESSPLLPGVELLTPVTGEVLSGMQKIVVKISSNITLSKLFEVYLLSSNGQPEQLHKEQVTDEKEYYVFYLNASRFKDAICDYRLLFRFKGKEPSETMQDVTGYFSIMNSPKRIKWFGFKNNYSTNISSITEWPFNGEIRLYKPGTGEIVFLGRVNLLGIDLDKAINFSYAKVDINALAFPCWKNPGHKARIRFYGLKFNYPKILLDGEECTKECSNINYANGSLVFDLYRLGSVQVVEGLTSRLTTHNPSRDLREYTVGEPIPFTANYTTLAGIPLHGAGVKCKIIFPVQNITKEMSYNPSKKLYYAEVKFWDKGKFDYLVQCGDIAKAENNNSVYGAFEVR